METDRGPVCGDCWHGCPRPAHWAACDHDDCRCECRDLDGGRARELDDRPDEALASIARDLEAERLPTLDELRAERFGPLRRVS